MKKLEEVELEKLKKLLPVKGFTLGARKEVWSVIRGGKKEIFYSAEVVNGKLNEQWYN